MATVSLCMIVKNEEAVLARCLDSIKKAVDEIIIVDTGSTDKTKEIARRFTKKIYDFEWCDDFAAARNFAFDKGQMDYRMWLDADDVVPEESVKELLDLKKHLDSRIEIVTMKYYTHFDSQGLPINISTRGRLFKRETGHLWEDPIHEYIALAGNIYYSDIVIHHLRNIKENQGERNIRIYEALEKSDKPFSPRQLYYYARELRDHGQWAKAAYYFERFLEGERGWEEDNIAACHALGAMYAALGENKKVVPALVRAFTYGAPRAEICSELGYYYKRLRNIPQAYAWFKVAANLGEPNTIGFILRDYWGYIPNIECSVCAFELGDRGAAVIYNEKAAKYKPDDPAVAYNREFFGVSPQPASS